MRTAIATSLVIIVLKSLVGFFRYQQFLLQHDLSVDWTTIGTFVAIGMLGCFVGQQLNSRLNQRALKQAFAVFLVFIGLFVIFREGREMMPANKTQTTQLFSILGQNSSSTVSVFPHLL